MKLDGLRLKVAWSKRSQLYFEELRKKNKNPAKPLIRRSAPNYELQDEFSYEFSESASAPEEDE